MAERAQIAGRNVPGLAMLLIGIVIGAGAMIAAALALAAGQFDWSSAPKGCVAGGRVCVGMSAD